ncbi:MAG: radical SAM protein [Agathobacter sp.]|nr:radical SAM protein [Agathobacter sp.]
MNFIQVTDDFGNVRSCSWIRDAFVGNLLEESFEKIYHGELASKVRERLSACDYSLCNRDDCPWLSCGEMEEHLIEIEEVPEYPDYLSLSFENACNYNCITCTMHERMIATDKLELEKRYDVIEERLKGVLPHIKHISANGQGEVFVSKRILSLLANWKPLAPKEECSASIETNGSLFDEMHWKKIQNLGQYHLTVTVTVMSFDEYTYQKLSGTKLPISQIEKNLMFIKSLREQGIVDEFRIATVVQERNFRELPFFARRCIEEFGADYVRLRSFVPWGKKPLEVEWFTDVINPYHPYHEEYVEIMKDPIFKHPKVHDWSGGIGTTLGEHPWKRRLDYANRRNNIMQKYILEKDYFVKKIHEMIPLSSKVYIYGIGEVGKMFFDIMKMEYKIEAIIDNNSCESLYKEINIVKGVEISQLDKLAYILVTPIKDSQIIKNQLQEQGFYTEKIIIVDKLF